MLLSQARTISNSNATTTIEVTTKNTVDRRSRCRARVDVSAWHRGHSEAPRSKVLPHWSQRMRTPLSKRTSSLRIDSNRHLIRWSEYFGNFNGPKGDHGLVNGNGAHSISLYWARTAQGVSLCLRELCGKGRHEWLGTQRARRHGYRRGPRFATSAPCVCQAIDAAGDGLWQHVERRIRKARRPGGAREGLLGTSILASALGPPHLSRRSRGGVRTSCGLAPMLALLSSRRSG